MSVFERRMTIPATFDAVPAAVAFVMTVAAAVGLDQTKAHHCALSVDEACTNIVEHGYRGNSPDRQIEIACRVEGGELRIVIEDSGPPFNPLTAAEQPPADAARLEDAKIGGWGIAFIRRLMDRIEYQRIDARNRLTLIKRLDAVPDEAQNRLGGPEVSQLTEAIYLVTPSARGYSPRLDSLDAVLRGLIDRGQTNLVIDLSAIERVTTADLKMLVGHWRRARDLKGNVVLTGVRPAVHEAFTILGLDLVFALAASPRDAIAHFSKRR